MSDDGPAARLSAILRHELVSSVLEQTAGPPAAVGWGTVELDRAMAELGAALRIPAGQFIDAPGSVILGARCLVASNVLPGGVALIVLEPNTEGRLAATLAKRDEGPAAVWLAASDLAGVMARLDAVGHQVSPAQAGPCGTERLVDGPRFGPHLLLVEGPGTILA